MYNLLNWNGNIRLRDVFDNNNNNLIIVHLPAIPAKSSSA